MPRIGMMALILGLLFGACGFKPNPANAEVQVQTGYAQGTTYVIKYRSQPIPADSFQIIFDAIDASLSLWDPQSILSKINRGDSGVKTDPYFRAVFEASKEIYALTDGAFDPTVLPLVQFWGFGGDKFTFPDSIAPGKVDSLRRLQGFDQIYLSGEKVRKGKSGIQLDFNGIAQGYTVDVLGAFLERQQVKDFMIEVGGEILARGNGTTGDGWNIAIDKPVDPDAPREIQAILKIREAMATSGSYRKFYEKDGTKYSHTIDPRTGYPVTHSLLSVSVIAPSAMWADAYATAFMVMGVQQTMAFLQEHPDIMVYMIFSDPLGQLDTWMSEGLKERMVMERTES